MRTRNNILAIIMAVLMVFAMMPMTTGEAFASTSGEPGLVIGTGVLGTDVNTDDAQTVYYGTNGGIPVAWRVIKYKNAGNAYIEDQTNAMTLFASDILRDDVQFNPEKFDDNDYEGSNLKSVVDGLYVSLFSTQEKSAIKIRELAADEFSYTSPYSTGVSGSATSGYLWPLSTAEAFALPSNEFRSVGESWWLRSPGDADYKASYVMTDGKVYITGFLLTVSHSVRPAFNLDLSSVLFISAAAGGKSSGTVGAGALQQISTNTTGEWKLTVLDSNLDTFQASAANGPDISAEAGYTSWSIPIAYSLQSDDPTFILPEPDAQNHVAAILADSRDNALYYGVIDINNYGGTKNINIPAGLPAGAYKLHVFIEMTKGDYLTDYASPLRTIDLTVTAPTYTVTVNNGSGGDEYTEGADVTITAAAPDPGKRFKEWTGVEGLSFKSGSSATTARAIFTMPGHDVTVTANYEDIPSHPVSVQNGTGGGDYYEGAEVEITAAAPDPGMQFKEWTGDVDRVTFTEGSKTTSTAKFTMPGEPLFFKATYEAIPAATYVVTVNNGDGDGEYAKDAVVTITADAPATGKQFKEWTGDVDKVTFTEGGKTTSTAKFKMPAEALTFEARYEDIPAPPVETFTVTFKAAGGKWTDGTTADKEVTVEKGKPATAPKAPARDGYTFNGWDKDFSSVTSDLTVTAKWKVKAEPVPPKPTPDPIKPANGATEGASAAAVTKYLITRQDDSDAPGSTYGKLTARVAKAGKTSQTISWQSVPGAVKYNVYGNQCGKANKLILLGSVTGTSYSHAGLKKGTYYKYMVVAVDRKGKVAASSKMIHSATTGGKVGNCKKIKTAAKKNKVNLKAGKKFKLKAKMQPAKKKLKIKKHRAVCYESSNPAVATVTGKGVIKGVSKGKCIVYAYGQNGVFAKIKVTIK